MARVHGLGLSAIYRTVSESTLEGNDQAEAHTVTRSSA